VPDGGFSDLQLSYPSPHHVRRNFTLLSFRDIQFIIVTDRQKIGNTSFSASVIEGILETPAGDYKEFQTMLEVPEVKT
jgi:tyrosinase